MRAIVTGASGGIGHAIALEIVRQGGRCVVIARNEHKLRELAEAAGSTTSGQIEIVAGDVTTPEVRARAIASAIDTWGGLDALVNNAGIAAFGRFREGHPDRLREIMEVNFFAVTEMIRESLPALESGNSPIVVNVGSILGHRGIPRMNEYCASKFAVQGFSQTLRVELGRDGIDLLVVSPGTTKTDFYDHVVHGRDDAPWSTGYSVSAENVARVTVKAMRRGRREIYPNAAGRMLVWLNRLAPSLVDRLMRRYA
jgi:short-subunit dehydrogenase